MASQSSTRLYRFAKPLSEVITAVPSTPADLCATDAQIWQVSVCNTTAGALTFSLYDKQATPRYAVKAKSIAANDTVIYAWPEGLFLSGGITWGASNTGLEVSIVGSYKS